MPCLGEKLVGGSVSASFPLHSNATTLTLALFSLIKVHFFVCREVSPGGNVAIQHTVTDYSSDYYYWFH